MKKIPTLFERNPNDRSHVTRTPNPAATWVLNGEGEPTRKYDGTCVMLDTDGAWWARREVKDGKPHPANWTPVDHDEITGKTMGWEPIQQSSFAKFHAEALARADAPTTPGTYELVGPKINGNPEQFAYHDLVRHGAAVLSYIPYPPDFDGLQTYLLERNIEGIVWHHPDGRMAKLKRKDFQ